MRVLRASEGRAMEDGLFVYRNALLERIAPPEPLTVEDAERAERLGFALGGPYRPFVALLADDTPYLRTRPLAATGA